MAPLVPQALGWDEGERLAGDEQPELVGGAGGGDVKEVAGFAGEAESLR